MQLQWVLSHFGQNIGPKKFPSLIVVPHYQLLQGIQGPTEMGESEHFGLCIWSIWPFWAGTLAQGAGRGGTASPGAAGE